MKVPYYVNTFDLSYMTSMIISLLLWWSWEDHLWVAFFLSYSKDCTAAVSKYEGISLLEWINGYITRTFRTMSAKLFWRCLHWQGQWTWNRVAFMVLLRNFVNNQTRFLDFLQSCLKQHSMSKEISKILYLKMRFLITGDRFIVPSCFRL